MAVNCGAIPENLLESELFGHVKGSFTGSIKDKKGKFELAGNGTLFLDEISEISPNLQVKLLRILQEKEFERVGDSETIKADVRILAATNRNLKDKVKRGEFREDLFYRLNSFPIVVPPLRSRRGDIVILIEHFIDKFNEKLETEIKGVTKKAMKILFDYVSEKKSTLITVTHDHELLKGFDRIIDFKDIYQVS